MAVLFLHETHEVAGLREEAFEVALRERWMPSVARGEGARLLYFLRHAHGTGVSYNIVTVTALRDASAWGELLRRVHAGDLQALSAELDGLRHDVFAKMLIPLPWSPLQEIDLAAVPTGGVEHEPTLFMEDTVWPDEGKLEEYVERSGSHYAEEMRERAGGGRALLAVQAGFRTAFGSGRRREVVLWQKVVAPKGLVPLLTREVPEAYQRPGTWMHDALALRDRWASRLLRTSSWSPWS